MTTAALHFHDYARIAWSWCGNINARVFQSSASNPFFVFARERSHATMSRLKRELADRKINERKEIVKSSSIGSQCFHDFSIRRCSRIRLKTERLSFAHPWHLKRAYVEAWLNTHPRWEIKRQSCAAFSAPALPPRVYSGHTGCPCEMKVSRWKTWLLVPPRRLTRQPWALSASPL